jgi:ZIP family zinc transporter
VGTDAFEVTAAALVTALATGLGALPLLSPRLSGRRALGLADAAAAGFMLSASLVLVLEGGSRGVLRTAAGALVGAFFIELTHRSLAGRHDLSVGALRGADALKAVTIVAAMTVHSFSEGVGVGVAYGGNAELGVFVTAAIAVHNIPEGLAISLVLVPRGVRVTRAAGWSIFTSLPQPLLALPAFLFVETFQPFLPAGLGFAAGAMTWLTVRELLPDAREHAAGRSVGATLGSAFLAMLVLQALLLRL